MRGEDSTATACVLAALGREDFETDAENTRAIMGAWIMVQLYRDIHLIRRALTQST